MEKDEIIKWLRLIQINLGHFPEISNEKKIEALGEAIRLLKNEQSKEPSSSEKPNKSEIPTSSYNKSETLVRLDVYKQVAKERDIAIEQLHELGYEFGQKIESTEKCIWIKYDYRTMCPKEHDVDNPYWRIPENRMKTLKYCPFCGKEIEVEE